MKARNTIILLLIAGGLFCYLRFYETKQPTTQEAEEEGNHVVPVLDRDNINGITITNNQAKIELEKKDNEWEMTEPVKDRADDTVVSELLTSLESLEKETSLPPDSKVDIGDLG
ncbi:MAG: DUF4340 domain-containing protein, partial [Chthoniobacteraceae bacterium]